MGVKTVVSSKIFCHCSEGFEGHLFVSNERSLVIRDLDTKCGLYDHITQCFKIPQKVSFLKIQLYMVKKSRLAHYF